MEMSLLHAGLAAGAALAALPVILHLFMKQTPKHVIFPALRLVRERQRRSKKRMRIKNWLLLLARMAVLALMALALARPTLYSQVPLGDQSVPTAMGLVFDTSLSMKYKDKDKTRLEEAKERAREIVSKLPDSSQVFVVDSSEPGSTGLSPPAALKRIDELTIHPVSRPLNVAMGEVYEKVAGCDKPVRVVYVLTDLARSAWDASRPAEGLDKVEKINAGKKGRMVDVRLAGLTPQEIRNVSVDSAEPSQSIVTQGEPVEIRSRIRSQAKGQPAAPTRTVEFFIDGVKKNEKIIQLPAGDGQVEVTFPIPANLKEGELHRGEVALRGAPDPFEDDDRRYFTFRIRPAMKVLLVSDRHDDANFVASALDPDPSPSSPRTFVVDRNTTSEFQARDKNASDVICVHLPAQRRRARPGRLGRPEPVCPRRGRPGGRGRPPLHPRELQRGHPRPDPAGPDRAHATRGPRRPSARSPTSPTRCSRNTAATWIPSSRRSRSTATGASRPRATRAGDAHAPELRRRCAGPARAHVQGRRRPAASCSGRRRWPAARPSVPPDAWNEFPVKNWSFLVLMYLTVPYMAGASGEVLNFEAGEPVLLHLEPTVRYKSFSLTGPGPEDKPSSIPAPASRDTLEVPVPQQQPGQWTVKAMAEGDRPSVLGFSVNPPHSESQFTPLEKPDLDTIFGKDGYHLAEDAQALEKEEGIARTGNELFPFLMILILIVVTLENFLANTFYKEAPRAAAATARLDSHERPPRWLRS